MQKIRQVRYFGRYLIGKKLFLFAPVIAVGIFVAGVFVYQFTTVKTVVVKGPKDRTLIGLDAFKNKSIMLVTQKEVSRIVAGQNPTVKSVVIEKVFPDLIVVVPEFYAPLAFLVAGNGFFVVSQDGRILQKVREEPAGMVGVMYYQKLNYDAYQSGQTVDYSDIKTGLAALKVARDLGLTVVSVNIEGTNMIRLQLDDKTILFSAQKSIQLQAYQLERLVRQFALEGKDYVSIDVRFEKPVVRFAK